MKKLPKINPTFLSPLNKTVGKGSRVIINSCEQISPHVKAITLFVVDEVSKKADYAPDITAIKSKTAAPMSSIAKLLKVSSSYAYKISKK
nr:MAG TPA: hypothetical protein [Caudoviricetes sp.]